MAIVLATFILAVQEILDLLYFALLFINDQTERHWLLKTHVILYREYHTACAKLGWLMRNKCVPWFR